MLLWFFFFSFGLSAAGRLAAVPPAYLQKEVWQTTLDVPSSEFQRFVQQPKKRSGTERTCMISMSI